MSLVHRIAHSPYLNLISGVVLLVSGGAEILHTLDEALLGAHHGVAVAGLIQVLQALPHIVHGSKEIEEAGEGEGAEG